MRKFKTKHGFTIVEVLVAFVIFAIMASMVSAILSTTMKTKQENVKIEKEILDQQTAYYVNTNLDNRGDNSAKSFTDGTLSLNFTAGNVPAGGITVNNISVDNVEPTDNVSNNSLVLEYYVGNVNYNTLTTPPENKPGDNNGGSITERIDSRIYGANKLNELEMNIVKDLSYTDAHRYFISFSADTAYGDSDTTIESIFKYFSQLRFNFTSSNEVLDCGYVDVSSGKFGSILGDWLYGGSVIEIVPTSPYSVRIAGLQQKDSSLQKLTGSPKGVYVTLAQPLDDTLASFAMSESDTEADLYKRTTTINKKSIDANYNISNGSGVFTVEEATAYMADLRAKKAQLSQKLLVTPVDEVDASGNKTRDVYTNKIAELDSEISYMSTELRKVQYQLDANAIFGYTTSKEEQNLNGDSNKFVYKEYITYDESNNETVQPGVLGGYKKAETTTPSETPTPEPEETE